MTRPVTTRPGRAVFEHGRPARVIALIGNPNVGKSTLFNQVTGSDVVTAHYSGKTSDVNIGETSMSGMSFSVVDVPGTYSISGPSDEAWVARHALRDAAPDVVIVVVDATNLSRNLALMLEVADLGYRCVIALNLSDEARAAGITVDPELLSALVGVPVVPTVAVDGIGVAELIEAAIALVREGGAPGPGVADIRVRYGDAFERGLEPLIRSVEASRLAPFGLRPRSTALLLVQADPEIEELLRSEGATGLLRVAEEARRAIAAIAGEPPFTVLARERHGAAGVLADRCSSVVARQRRRAEEYLLALSTRASTGIPLLVVLLGALFATLFFVGKILASAVGIAWAATFSPLVQAGVRALAGDGAVAKTLLWGLDAGLEASIAIGIPYILTFYFLLALLEDSGYLNAVAFLSDRVMHRLGLHGRAIIPLVAGAGCSVPAVLAVRVLPTDRERFLTATLVSMVPCSARTAVVLGAVGAYVGWLSALGVFLVTAVVTILVGVAMNRFVPGGARGMVMEMFPFRRPRVSIVARKAWTHFKEFLFVATPLVVVGSIALGGLYELGLLAAIAAPLEPVTVGLLGLPAFAGITLVFGLLRKEFALQLLITLAIATTGAAAQTGLAELMTPTQIFVYALVNTLAMPCISTVAVLGRTLGWKRASVVMAITVSVALFVGGLFARILPLVVGSVHA